MDVGCGDQKYTKKIPDCIGVDSNEEFEGTVNRPDQIMSATDLDFPNSKFANICFLDTLEHIPDIEKAIYEAYRVLKPRGCMVIIDPNDVILFIARVLALRFRDAYKGNPDHIYWLNGEDLVRLMSPYFKLEKWKCRFIFNGYKFRSNKKIE